MPIFSCTKFKCFLTNMQAITLPIFCQSQNRVLALIKWAFDPPQNMKYPVTPMGNPLGNAQSLHRVLSHLDQQERCCSFPQFRNYKRNLLYLFYLKLFIYTLEIELALLNFSKIIPRTGRDVGSCEPCHRVILRPNALVPEIIIYIGDLKTIVSRTNVFSCKITL